MMRIISTSFAIMLIGTTQVPRVQKVKSQRTARVCRTTNTVASIELNYHITAVTADLH